MIPIKVQCSCGQRYSFEVEPVNGRMPSPVGCPVCGADGTAAANAAIAQCQPALMAAAPPPARVVSLHAATPAPALQVAAAAAAAYPAAARRPTLLPGQLERPQAETEARAKILWGDPPEEVVKFLMRQGVPAGEASEIVNALFQQRAATIRTNGITKIVTGCAMICVPIAAWLIFASMGYLPLKIFAVTVMVGLWGAYQVLKGVFMVCAPRREAGDVAEQ